MVWLSDKRRGWPGRFHRGSLFLAIFICLLFSGCVYSRLFLTRKQLADFDSNFSLTHSPGAYLEVFEPVLTHGDLHWLTGLKPAETRLQNGMEYRTYRFDKLGSPSPQDARYRLVWMEAGFQKGLLHSLRFPVNFNEVLTLDLMRRAFDGAEGGEIDPSEGSTGWALHQELEIPDQAKIFRLFGIPSSIRKGPSENEQLFMFHASSPPESTPEKPHLWFRFRYEQATGLMTGSDIQVGWLRVIIRQGDDFRYRVHIRRGKHESP